jgi:hypothetical protein
MQAPGGAFTTAVDPTEAAQRMFGFVANEVSRNSEEWHERDPNFQNISSPAADVFSAREKGVRDAQAKERMMCCLRIAAFLGFWVVVGFLCIMLGKHMINGIAYDGWNSEAGEITDWIHGLCDVTHRDTF